MVEQISRRELLLLLLGTASQEGGISEGFGGITRLQKFIFLLQEEQDIQPTENGFEFRAYKAGPYSSKLYDDLEFLENLGLVRSEVAAEATEEEAVEVDLLTFEELMEEGSDSFKGSTADGFGAADAYEERRFFLTDMGLSKVKSLIANKTLKPITDGIRKIKSRYGSYSLTDLLAYIYTKYPEMAVESEIRDKVLRRRSNS